MDKKTCLFSNDTPVVLIYWLLKNTMNVVINGGNESFEKKKNHTDISMIFSQVLISLLFASFNNNKTINCYYE